MKIKIEAELDLTDVCEVIKTWFRKTLDITPEFSASANQRHKKVAGVDIKEPVKADMEKDAEAYMKKATESGTKKPAKIDKESVDEQVRSYIGAIEFSVVVQSSSNGDANNAMPKITFEKMYMPTPLCYNYFKLPEGMKIKDGEMLNFHGKSALEEIKVTNVLKGGEEPVQVKEIL